MKNLDIRMTVSEKGLHFKDLATIMGVRPESLSRMMRSELTPDQRSRIQYAIQVIEDRGRAE